MSEDGSVTGPERDRPRALITDWGGVLTKPLSVGLGPWLELEGIDRDEFAALMREWLRHGAPSNPAHDLESGRITGDEFGRALATRIRRTDGSPIVPEGIIERMFAGFEPVPEMFEVIRRARAAGFATALLSNSWGNDYPTETFGDLFDDVVISGEVGMRKPDHEIYRLSAERLGVPLEQSVFIDDLRPNIRSANDLGMIGIHHTSVQSTVAELESLFGVSLQEQP